MAPVDLGHVRAAEGENARAEPLFGETGVQYDRHDARRRRHIREARWEGAMLAATTAEVDASGTASTLGQVGSVARGHAVQAGAAAGRVRR
jgi:hypothetical protein